MTRAGRAAAAMLSIGLCGCRGAAPGSVRTPPRVDHLGSMREMFESGSAASKVSLEPLLGLKRLYALGPLEGLQGEILVWDGTPFVSRMERGEVRVAVDRGAKAPFLVWSSVKTWRDVDVPEEARTLAGLESWLPQAANAARVDGSRPFAFLVVGAVEKATIHVVDLPSGTPLTREAHEAAKHAVAIERAPVQMLGFFAADDPNAAGVWTHHTTRVHLHLRTQIGTLMGHVDDFTLAKDAVVKIAAE